MARPRSLHSSLGKRTTSTSVKPLFAARLMIAAARARRSSSDTPDGFENFSINAFFSASAAESSRAAADGFLCFFQRDLLHDLFRGWQGCQRVSSLLSF